MISNKTQKPQWTRLQRALAWLSFGVFFFGFVLYMFGYTGNSWYVSPVVNNQYPPDNPIDPIHFGLFYLCFRGHCKYDLRQDYQIVGLIPEELGEYSTQLHTHTQLRINCRQWGGCIPNILPGIYSLRNFSQYLAFCSLLSGPVR